MERDRQSKASKKPTQSHESEVSAQKGIVEQNSVYWGKIQRSQLGDFEGEQGMRQGCWAEDRSALKPGYRIGILDTFCLSVSLWTVLDAMDGSQSLADQTPGKWGATPLTLRHLRRAERARRWVQSAGPRRLCDRENSFGFCDKNTQRWWVNRQKTCTLRSILAHLRTHRHHMESYPTPRNEVVLTMDQKLAAIWKGGRSTECPASVRPTQWYVINSFETLDCHHAYSKCHAALHSTHTQPMVFWSDSAQVLFRIY